VINIIQANAVRIEHYSGSTSGGMMGYIKSPVALNALLFSLHFAAVLISILGRTLGFWLVRYGGRVPRRGTEK